MAAHSETVAPPKPAESKPRAAARPQPQGPKNDTLFAVVGLRKHFPVKGGLLQRTIAKVRAVDDVTFEIKRGETLAMVGESGCGKTTMGRLLLHLIEPTEGDVLFNVPSAEVQRVLDARRQKGGSDGQTEAILQKYSLTRLGRRRMVPYRRHMQPVFQDPFTSLDPRMLVKDIIAEPILINQLMTKEEAYDRAGQLLKEVGLGPEHLYRFPHEFSGGQRQRIAVARALAPFPEFLMLDEPTSALDVSVQAQILNLLKDIQRKQQLTYLLITHNLSVVRQMSDRVAVMYLGRIMEEAPTADLFANPMHPYTKALLAAVPVPDPKKKRDRLVLAGDVPSPIAPPAGCRFHTRCPQAFEKCGWNPEDIAEMASFLFDGSRNPEASGLPAIKQIVSEPATMHLQFAQAPTEAHRALVESLVHVQAARKDGMAFRAIAKVSLHPESIDLEFPPPFEPELVQASQGHRVACFLFPTGIDGESAWFGPEAKPT